MTLLSHTDRFLLPRFHCLAALSVLGAVPHHAVATARQGHALLLRAVAHWFRLPFFPLNQGVSGHVRHSLRQRAFFSLHRYPRHEYRRSLFQGCLVQSAWL